MQERKKADKEETKRHLEEKASSTNRLVHYAALHWHKLWAFQPGPSIRYLGAQKLCRSPKPGEDIQYRPGRHVSDMWSLILACLRR